ERGGSDKSFGIHVAKLAGLPLIVVNRAKTILEKLEEGDPVSTHVPSRIPSQKIKEEEKKVKKKRVLQRTLFD
ncbi:MAG: hypothetical protein ACXQS8_06075, partial [Candidatus Helarchaeales archaeon]